MKPMSRVVNINNPGKIRSRLMRTSAELLRHLSQKATLDEEAKDMAAAVMLCLRGIEEGIESSAEAWEKRDYWIKAEQLRQRWAWAGDSATRLEHLIRSDDWDSLPTVMAGLFGHFAEIKVTKMTRDSNEWQGAYLRFLNQAE
jgi:hypothetical protein